MYRIGEEKLEQLIRAGRIKIVEGSLPMRVYDPLWAAAFGLRPVSSEQIPLLQCGEMAELLGLKTRTMRYISRSGENPFPGPREKAVIQRCCPPAGPGGKGKEGEGPAQLRGSTLAGRVGQTTTADPAAVRGRTVL